jgi:hypothetical protein
MVEAPLAPSSHLRCTYLSLNATCHQPSHGGESGDVSACACPSPRPHRQVIWFASELVLNRVTPLANLTFHRLGSARSTHTPPATMEILHFTPSAPSGVHVVHARPLRGRISSARVLHSGLANAKTRPPRMCMPTYAWVFIAYLVTRARGTE